MVALPKFLNGNEFGKVKERDKIQDEYVRIKVILD
jgi:hypothetical protein